MKRSNEHIMNTQHYICLVKRAGELLIFITVMLITSIPSAAQVKQLIQVKTFDQKLQPMKDIEVSINGNEFISIGGKGTSYIEMNTSELPPRTIRIKNELLEPASWNYSKGIIEIIIRKKNYELTYVTLKSPENIPLANLSVTYKGKKTITVTSDANGKLGIPLALGEKIGLADQFSVNDHQVIGFQPGPENLLTIDRLKPIVSTKDLPAVQANKTTTNTTKSTREYFKNFNLSQLDSIQSLTMFYAIFKNYNIKELKSDEKQKVDAKFNQLVALLQDSVRQNEKAFIGKISDSSFVRDDIKNLLNQAKVENLTLYTQRSDFDEKIRIINNKLAKGITNLDGQTRAMLLSDLTLLERLLTENESRFFKNQNDYLKIINALKEKYFDFQNLEHKLSESEAQRLEEQRVFRKRLLAISGVVIAFAILIILLISFSGKLRRQKKALVKANAEVKRINESLEEIVLVRTRLLEEAIRELDTFLYRASHDLRSPVCSILGLCNIALLHLAQGEPKELVQKVAYTTEGMDRLLKKLSIISEINKPSNYSTITLLDIVKNIQSRYHTVIEEHRIQFLTDCPADLVFDSYPSLIEVILTSLIENALFYSVMRNHQHPRVEFNATIKNDHIEFIVYDNGVGVDSAIRHRLFDMFFKGHENSKGNGLGLYIVYKSVQALDGKITVESEQGNYTRFMVNLPLHVEVVKEELVLV